QSGGRVLARAGGGIVPRLVGCGAVIAPTLAPTGEMGNPGKHKGEPKLPFNFVVACSFFIIEGRPVVVFGSRCPLPLFLAIPIRDQEQTYFFER
ncbi:hypothetical protein, partial [Pseudomonas sp. N8]|uniref:hypothetical protein n=1 Tax=Pseudomonas sp. N8 TaxID=3449428 RepID=UPI003F699652